MSALFCAHTFGAGVMALVCTYACNLLSVQLAGCGCGLGMESTGYSRFQELEIAGGLEELYVFHSLGGFLGGLPNTSQLWLTVPA